MTPAAVNVQIKGYEEQVKLRTEESNVNSWLTGAYVRLAVASTLDSSVDYPEKPFGMEQEKASESWQAAKMKMAGFAASVENSLKQKQGKNAKRPLSK